MFHIWQEHVRPAQRPLCTTHPSYPFGTRVDTTDPKTTHRGATKNSLPFRRAHRCTRRPDPPPFRNRSPTAGISVDRHTAPNRRRAPCVRSRRMGGCVEALLEKTFDVGRPAFIEPKVACVGLSARGARNVSVESEVKDPKGDQRDTIPEPRVGDLLDDVDETPVACEKCCLASQSARSPHKLEMHLSLGVTNVRHAFSYQTRLSNIPSLSGTQHVPCLHKGTQAATPTSHTPQTRNLSLCRQEPTQTCPVSSHKPSIGHRT
jgi:hypothetical protein